MISRSQGVTSLRFQSAWPAKDIFHEFALDFAGRVSDASGGELKIDVLPAGAVVAAFGLLDAVSKGTLDVLMEAGWVRTAGRRESPGRPLLYATTPDFLTHFGLSSRRDLPGIDDLKAAGLLDPLEESVLQLQLETEGEED